MTLIAGGDIPTTRVTLATGPIRTRPSPSDPVVSSRETPASLVVGFFDPKTLCDDDDKSDKQACWKIYLTLK